MRVAITGPYIELRGSRPRGELSPYAEVLTSPFAGNDQSDIPAASGFGTLAKIVRLNHIATRELSSLLGIRVRRTDDLSAVMAFSEARQVSVAKSLRLPAVPVEWNVSTWFPFKAPSSLLATGWTFRYCPECLLAGYHTLLHQMPWVDRCAWHDVSLREDCRHCGRPVAVHADWVAGANLECKCGQSPLDTDLILRATAPEGAKRFTDQYLQWAAEERSRSLLVIPNLAGDPRSALTRLVDLPGHWRSCLRLVADSRIDTPRVPLTPFPQVHVRTLSSSKRAPLPDRDGLLELEQLRRDRPGFLKTPERLAPMMSAVAANLALRLPAQSLTDREMSLFLAGMGVEAPKSFAPARRRFSAEVSMLPPSFIGNQQFLNLLCVHPCTYLLLVGLVDAALERRNIFDFHAQASHQEFDLLMRSCGQLLARGYAEGLRSTLAPHVPEIYIQPRLSPHLRQPWAVVRKESGRLSSIRIAWIPLSYARRGEAAVLEAADHANQSRRCSGRRRRK